MNYIYLNILLNRIHKISIMALKVGDLVLISIPEIEIPTSTQKFILNNNNFLCNKLDIGHEK